LESSEDVPQTGDVIAYTLENDRYIMGSARPSWLQQMYRWTGASATHMAIQVIFTQGFRVSWHTKPDKLDQLGDKVSHMWGAPESVYTQVCLLVWKLPTPSDLIGTSPQTPNSIGLYGNTFYRPEPSAWIDGSLWGDKIVKAYGVAPGMSWEDVVMQHFREAVRLWHEQNAEFLSTLKNDAAYRILVAVMFNTISLRERPWRDRAQFQADCFKSRNQVACSEFVIKVAMQCADLLGRSIAARLIASGVDVTVDPSGATIVDPKVRVLLMLGLSCPP
jgi:hypothetical protein